MDLKKIIQSVFCASAFIAVSSAIAGGMTELPPADDTYNTNLHLGDYLSVNGGVPLMSSITNGASTQKGLGNGIGGSVYGGYQFSHPFAIEGGASYYALGFGNFAILGFSAKGVLPLGLNAVFFAKAGVSYVTLTTYLNSVQSTNNRFAPTFGAGLGYGFSRRWMGTVEYDGAYVQTPQITGAIGGLTVGLTRYFDV